MESKLPINTPRSVFKNTLALFIGRITVMVGSIVLVFVLSRLLKAEGLGSYATAMALLGLGELACELGLSNYIPRELAKDLSQTNRFFVHTTLLAMASAVIAIGLLVLAGSTLGYSTETVLSIYLIAPALLPTVLQVIMGAIFLSHHKVEYTTYATLFWTIARISVSAYLLMQGYGILAVMIVYTVMSYLAVLTSIFFYVRVIERPHWEFDPVFARQLLTGLKTFILLSLAGSVFTQAETIILSIVRDDTQVGLYSAAYKLITVWYLIPSSFMGIVFPVLTQAYQQSPRRSQEIQNKATKYLLLLALPLSVGSFVIAAPVIHFFYGAGFEPAIDIFRIMSWHIILAFVNNVLWRILLATDKQHLALRVQVISGVVRVALSFWLASWLGAIGAAWALMGGFTVYTALHIYYLSRNGVNIPFFRLGARFMTACIGMGAVLYILTPYVHVLGLVPLGVIVYAGLVLVLKGFSADDIALFRRVRYPSVKEHDYAASQS